MRNLSWQLILVMMMMMTQLKSYLNATANIQLELSRKDRENAEALWKEDKKRLESECHKLETVVKDMRSEFERLRVKKEEELESLRTSMKADEVGLSAMKVHVGLLSCTGK